LSDRSRAASALAIMMTDVVGSTALRRSRGDRDADDILGLQAAIVHDQVAAFGGQVRKSLRRRVPDHLSFNCGCGPYRHWVWNSFSEFIGRAAQDDPLMLVLEDLHWADESTLLLTDYLTPLLPDMPVLVLGTYRDMEVDLHHPLAFFVEGVYLHLAESGVLLDEHGRIRTEPAVGRGVGAQSIRLVLGQRLDRLTASTRNVLIAATVSGRTFDSDVVSAVAGVDQDGLSMPLMKPNEPAF
jgi:hypothetical protein